MLGIDFKALKQRDVPSSQVRFLTPLPDTFTLSTKKYENYGLLLDTETSGLDPINDEIISLGYIKVGFNDDMKAIGVVAFGVEYNEPSNPLSDVIKNLTGLTDEFLKGKTITEKKVDEIFGDVDFCVSHNAAFDRSFIDNTYEKYSKMVWGCTLQDIDYSKYGIQARQLEYLMGKIFGYYMKHHEVFSDTCALYYLFEDNFSDIMKKMYEKNYQIRIFNSPYHTKDIIKRRGGWFWIKDQKCWSKLNMNEDQYEEEAEWHRSSGVGGYLEREEQFLFERHKDKNFS